MLYGKKVTTTYFKNEVFCQQPESWDAYGSLYEWAANGPQTIFSIWFGVMWSLHKPLEPGVFEDLLRVLIPLPLSRFPDTTPTPQTSKSGKR